MHLDDPFPIVFIAIFLRNIRGLNTGGRGFAGGSYYVKKARHTGIQSYPTSSTSLTTPNGCSVVMGEIIFPDILVARVKVLVYLSRVVAALQLGTRTPETPMR
jgi:hypothetical protein